MSCDRRRGHTSLEEAETLARRVRAAADAWRGTLPEFRLSLSIGVALVDPTVGPAASYRLADELMLAMKASARRTG
jgi:hypothetical protein